MYVRGGQSERSKGGGEIERYINGERERERERDRETERERMGVCAWWAE